MATPASLLARSAVAHRYPHRRPRGETAELDRLPTLLALQRLAGNAAVAALVGGVVQRSGCGGSCGCGGMCGEGGEVRSCSGRVRTASGSTSTTGAASLKRRKPSAGAKGCLRQGQPAGGRDTHFALGKPTTQGGVACDRHDECYQSCATDQTSCDARMFHDMKAVCAASGENSTVRGRCFQFAAIYYKALRVGTEGAFEDRRKAVCGCDSTLLPPALRLPPRHLLERNGKPVSWLDYRIMSSYPPLSAYKPIATQDEYDRYFAQPELPDFDEARRALRHL